MNIRKPNLEFRPVSQGKVLLGLKAEEYAFWIDLVEHFKVNSFVRLTYKEPTNKKSVSDRHHTLHAISKIHFNIMDCLKEAHVTSYFPHNLLGELKQIFKEYELTLVNTLKKQVLYGKERLLVDEKLRILKEYDHQTMYAMYAIVV